MFTEQRMRNILFEGYTDPSVLKYLNLKHTNDLVYFECVTNPYNSCGIQNYICDYAGLNLVLPNGFKQLLNYILTPLDEFFSPYFIVTANSSLLWPYSETPNLVQTANDIINHHLEPLVFVRNPIFAVHPAMNSQNKAFLQFIQKEAR